MTTRVQALRSSTTGAVPAAGARLPGELWTNFPDLQLGVIDTSKNAQKLVAVRFFSMTANYAVNDMVVQAGAIYFANGAITAGAFTPGQWTKLVSISDLTGFGANYLPIAGGTLTGDLILNRDPQVALGSATKQYVDGKVSAAPFLPIAGGTLTGKLTLSGPPSASLDAATKAYVDAGAFVPVTGGANTGLNDNRIINGDMRIDQRNNGASGQAAGYTVDRWASGGNLPNTFSWGRNLNGVVGPSGFPYCLGFQALLTHTPVAADQCFIVSGIEADMVSDFAWGTPQAQPVTLSFWANSSLTGTFSGSIIEYNTNARAYPFIFSIPAANAWTKIVLTIPGDTGGTWTLSGNGGGFRLFFDLGSGVNSRGPTNAWANGTYVGATGTVNVASIASAYLYLTGVKLEIGSVATPFNRQSLAKSMADCQRYYQQILGSTCVGIQGWNGAGSVTPYACTVGYQAMRAAPTAAYYGAWINTNGGTTNMYPSTQSLLLQANPTAGNAPFSVYPSNNSSGITLSAEL